MRGLLPVYLVQCLFLLYSLFLCVAYAAEASFDKKGLLEAVHILYEKVRLGRSILKYFESYKRIFKNFSNRLLKICLRI